MKISYSKYSAFLTNPERYRLYYVLGITPEDDEAPTRMNLGRRRGKCFHELREGVARTTLIETYGLDLVKRCEEMAAVVPDLGEVSHVEESFEVPILDGRHSITGRIDHGFKQDGVFAIGDFKTTKGTRTKKELGEYLGQMETSPQSHFYLKAARSLGFGTELFRYHVILDKKEKHRSPTYLPIDLRIGEAEVERTMFEVYAACASIEFLTNEYGIERPWPHSNNWPCCGDKFFCKYETLCGRTIPKGCAPEGFTNRYRDLIQLEDTVVG